MSKIELKDVSKEYDLKTMGLINVNLKVEDGDMLVVCGMAGAGKTTLLYAIAGLVDITHGTLEVNGKRYNDMPVKDRNMCLIDGIKRICNGKVYNHISLGLRLRRMSSKEIDVRVNEAAELLGITDILEERIKPLDEFTKRKVDLARAFVRDTHVVLLEEPLYSLVDDRKKEFAKLIRDLNQKTKKTFIISESQGFNAFDYGCKVAVLRDGKITSTGYEEDYMKNPEDPFEASYLGEDPMTIFTTDDGRLCGVRISDIKLASDGDFSSIVENVVGDKAYFRITKDSPLICIRSSTELYSGKKIFLRLNNLVEFSSKSAKAEL